MILRGYSKKIGFTLIELMVTLSVIVVIVSILTASFFDIRLQNRDAIRVSDISQLQMALRAYKRDLGVYPSVITQGQALSTTSTVYIAKVPTPPTPQDYICGDYPVYSSYYYVPTESNKSFRLYFCLGEDTADLIKGFNVASPDSIATGSPF